MAGSLLLLLDDVATVLDDVAAMTKAAAHKTAGVIADDLALNAKQVAGALPARELAVVLGVARGSALNKLLLVPAALAIGRAAPWAVAPLLVIGGAFLCYEGTEKLLHRYLHGEATNPDAGPVHSPEPGDRDPSNDERQRIAAAVRTDFILSAEIIVITLGVVAGKPFLTQVAVLAAISIAMTAGVYGLVALIVKLDDFGAMLAASRLGPVRSIGRGILSAAPWLLRALSVAGTAAMFLVGGGIVVHAVPAVHHVLHGLVRAERSPWLLPVTDGVVGVMVGLLLVGVKACLPRRNDAAATTPS